MNLYSEKQIGSIAMIEKWFNLTLNQLGAKNKLHIKRTLTLDMMVEQSAGLQAAVSAARQEPAALEQVAARLRTHPALVLNGQPITMRYDKEQEAFVFTPPVIVNEKYL